MNHGPNVQRLIDRRLRMLLALEDDEFVNTDLNALAQAAMVSVERALAEKRETDPAREDEEIAAEILRGLEERS